LGEGRRRRVSRSFMRLPDMEIRLRDLLPARREYAAPEPDLQWRAGRLCIDVKGGRRAYDPRTARVLGAPARLEERLAHRARARQRVRRECERREDTCTPDRP